MPASILLNRIDFVVQAIGLAQGASGGSGPAMVADAGGIASLKSEVSQYIVIVEKEIKPLEKLIDKCFQNVDESAAGKRLQGLLQDAMYTFIVCTNDMAHGIVCTNGIAHLAHRCG